MTKKLYYLSTCSTCKKIMDSLGDLLTGFKTQDIKHEPLTLDQVDEMRKLAGSYESLFSRKAMKYRALGLAEKSLDEEDYRKLIAEEYTFLKRPVFIVGEAIFIGNTKKVQEQLQQCLEEMG
ncbi:MAG: ArsC/Spx/MgsR family protein [Bacteroidota bacterium]